MTDSHDMLLSVRVKLTLIFCYWLPVCPNHIAGEGANFDYTINTNQVRALFRRPTPPDNVVFTFRVDAIAQETDESLSLQLVPTAQTTLPSGDGVFFRDTLSMMIVDSDSKSSIFDIELAAHAYLFLFSCGRLLH